MLRQWLYTAAAAQLVPASSVHALGQLKYLRKETMAQEPAPSLLTELELQQQGSAIELRSAQRISMSLASRNPTKNLLCQPPTVQSIPYYHTSGAHPHRPTIVACESWQQFCASCARRTYLRTS